MNEFNNNFIEYNDKDELFQKVLLVRLYDEYNKYKKITSNTKYDTVSLLKLRNSFEKISIEMDKISDVDNKEKKDFINNKMLILNSYLLNLDFDEREKIQKCVDLTTKLECLLKLPVTFPVSIERCLEQEIDVMSLKRVNKNGRIVR